MCSTDRVTNSVQNITLDDDDKDIISQPVMHFYQTQKTDAVLNFAQAFNYWFKLSDDTFNEMIKLLIEFRNVVKVQDDMIDNSKLRNGIPSAHMVYGRCRTIYATIYNLSQAVYKLVEFSKPDIIDGVIKTGMAVINGQGLEIYFQNNIKCPTEEEYFETISLKAVPIMELGFQALQSIGTKYPNLDLQGFLEKFGVYIQVHNDYICFKSKTYSDTKIFGEDITEGKFTLPIIHAIRTHPEDTQIIDILKQKTSDLELKRHFVDLLEKFGSLDYTLTVLQKLKQDCIAALEKTVENSEMKEILEFAVDNVDTILIVL